jgi:uncharacterized membrane protein YdjX (TVP38/TMEM64 family)
MKRLVALAFVVLVLAVVAVVLFRMSWVAEAVVDGSTRARRAGALGVIALAIVFTVAAIVFVPQVALAVPTGFSYGLAGGFAIAYPLSVAAALAAFALGRGLLRDRLERRFARDPRVLRLDTAVRTRGVLVVVLARLSPMFPFAPVNYLFSVTGVSTRQYVIGSVIGLAPLTLLYVYLGSIAPNAVAALRGDEASACHVVFPVAIAVMISAVFARLARRALRA